MNEKEKQIIIEGMKLFATKGYHKTSIQDIATNAHISKGAFYLHFSSKEEFMAHSFQYFHDEIVKEMAHIKAENDTPKQCLAKQITKITKYIYTYRDFIIMHLREDVSIGEHTEQLFRHMKFENVKWLQKSIFSIYGAQTEKYLMDLAIQLEGLMKSYFQWVVLDDIQINAEQFGVFIVDRVDDLVEGMIMKNAEPMIHPKNVPHAYNDVLTYATQDKQMKDILSLMNDEIIQLKLDAHTQKRLLNVVHMIGQKAKVPENETITIQGLLAHFNHIPELQQSCEDIAEILHIERLK